MCFERAQKVQFIRRFWIYGLIVVVVASHVAVITYVRAGVSRLKQREGLAVSLGEYLFQPVENKDVVYRMHLYALLDPEQKFRGRQVIEEQGIQLSEAIGQTLRQSNAAILNDPSHGELKKRLKSEIQKSLEDNFIDGLIITNWLELPSTVVSNTALSLRLSRPLVSG